MTLDAMALPQISRLLDIQLSVFPEHSKFLTRRFQAEANEQLAELEDLAGRVATLVVGEERQFARDYEWLCQEQINEELHFRRTGRYRLSSFADTLAQVYANKPYMTRYMNGLLMTQLWWSNHSQVMSYYRRKYLPTLRSNYSHLEIGPGHGLFLCLAANDVRCNSSTGWDISEASIERTRQALERMGVLNMPKLVLQDLFAAPPAMFDSIVFSEVLEHMEHPLAALEALLPLLAEDGRLFLNMPINSPAPDHLFNMETPAALKEFIEGAGFKVIDQFIAPATNQRLDYSIRKKLTISCAFILTRNKHAV